MRMRLAFLAAATSLVVIIAGCGSQAHDDSAGSSPSGSLNVLAAASLTESFDELKAEFTDQYPDVDVTISYDSSAILVEQVAQGADADVLATADTETMKKAKSAELLASEPKVFATNTLVLAVPPDNPAGITSLSDLAGSTFAICVREAPCGHASHRLFDLTGFTAQATTEEQNVKNVLTKVTSGEVDGGIVYKSDAVAAGNSVKIVDVDRADEVVNNDPIAQTSDSVLGRKWIELVTGNTGQKILAEHGFGDRP